MNVNSEPSSPDSVLVKVVDFSLKPTIARRACRHDIRVRRRNERLRFSNLVVDLGDCRPLSFGVQFALHSGESSLDARMVAVNVNACLRLAAPTLALGVRIPHSRR
jgi:hypothetical protein